MGLHLLLEERIGSLNPKQTELLLAAREDSERLLRMINDLLDLARLESGASRLLLEAVPAEEVVQPAVKEAEQQAEARRIHVKAEIEPNLPPVLVERRQVEHVFLNLISNAVKHSPTGEDLLIKAERDGYDTVKFSVVDHGPGIPREHQHRVFDRFFRVPGADRTGAGLGLAIAREIVIAHGGTIGVTSNPDRGSNFYFTLPACTSPVLLGANGGKS
jgi:signal transduction histidine kinase